MNETFEEGDLIVKVHDRLFSDTLSVYVWPSKDPVPGEPMVTFRISNKVPINAIKNEAFKLANFLRKKYDSTRQPC